MKGIAVSPSERCVQKLDYPERSVSVARVEGGQGKLLCLDCFNHEIELSVGIAILHSKYSPLDLADADGKSHRFKLAVRVYPDGISIESWELAADPGYRF